MESESCETSLKEHASKCWLCHKENKPIEKEERTLFKLKQSTKETCKPQKFLVLLEKVRNFKQVLWHWVPNPATYRLEGYLNFVATEEVLNREFEGIQPHKVHKYLYTCLYQQL